MDGGFPGECACGGIEFERVVVERPRGAYTTDFVACVRCRTMFFVPLAPLAAAPRSSAASGYGGPFDGSPVPDSDAKLKRDVADAAKDYVKPGRHTPPRNRR